MFSISLFFLGILLLIFAIKKNSGSTITKITENLYLSDYYSSLEYDKLHELGIKQILTIGKELPPHKAKYFKRKHIYLSDIPCENISKYFNETYNFIEQDITLVHCFAGISRSSTIVIAYLMKKYKITYNQAYEYVKNKRPIIMPNNGFTNQLLHYEEELYKPYI
jgi:dual specificity phosphatase 12